MYLNQLGLKAKADKKTIVRKLNGNGCQKTPEVAADVIPEMKLPPKRKIPFREMASPAEYFQEETIYDSLPKPRPCLSEDQVLFPKEHQNSPD